MYKLQHSLKLFFSATSSKDLVPSFSLLSFFMLLLASNAAYANPFETSANLDNPATCPAGNKMYYMGATPPVFSPINVQPLSWPEGNPSNTFTFVEPTGNKTFKIEFTDLLNVNSTGGQPPYYREQSSIAYAAINMQHDSRAVETNHILNININRPISKMGYKIQDLDSLYLSSVNQTPYIEQVDASADNGRLTFNRIFHTINTNRDIVTAIEAQNCGLINGRMNECTIDATWGYKPANSNLALKHNNTFRERNSYHAIAYSDFYFCLAPPKIIVNKLLNGSRVDSDDQFRIELRQTNNNAFVEAFTTTGSGSVLTDNTTTVTTLREGFNYTVSERTFNGNLLDYQTTYTCSNAATGTDVVFSSGTMPVNAEGTRRTFAINNVNYGDEITCNITNTPNIYTFSGIVFNDNGGIAANSNLKQDISATFINNKDYFNGIYDEATESGIADSNLSVRLTDCNNNNIANTTAQTVSSTGRYEFIVPASALSNRTAVCLVEEEPSSWDYKIDTTPDVRRVTLDPSIYNYQTEINSAGEVIRNLDFGEVKSDNSSLVLIKSQFVHQCDNDLRYREIEDNGNPSIGFSINPISDIAPNNCIAYRIQAYNRGHIDLKNIQISDRIQDAPVVSTFELPAPLFIPTTFGNPTVSYGTNGVIKSNLFDLDATRPAATRPTSATLYFNTKYGALPLS